MNRSSYLFVLILSLCFSCQSDNKKESSVTESAGSTETTETRGAPKKNNSTYSSAVDAPNKETVKERAEAMEKNGENNTRGNKENVTPSYTDPNDLPIVGTYKYNSNNKGNGTLVISKGPANAYNFTYNTEGPKPALSKGSMEGFFVLIGNKARFGTKGENGKCVVLFTFDGDKVTTSLETGEADDCGSFGNGVAPNAAFTKVK